MKRLTSLLAFLAFAGAASAQSSYYLQNDGRIHNVTQTYAAVNGAGGSLSHAEGSAQAVATGSVAVSPGSVAVTGAVSGFNNATAFNTAYGSGVGSASSQGWSDARTFGNASSTLPTGSVSVNGIVDGGMTNPVRNGTDVHVSATTAQDGFVNAMYNGGFAINGSISQTPIAGGASVFGAVQDTKYSHGEVVAGGVTFSGGTPAGQSAAVRWGNSGVTVEANGQFIDPAH